MFAPGASGLFFKLMFHVEQSIVDRSSMKKKIMKMPRFKYTDARATLYTFHVDHLSTLEIVGDPDNAA
ncbi:hypothetical protein ACG33_07850 [Steroidobacter denitrificans]|uniref:Uncharacterized protein n=1 Tax=Steroidobacter denitrificans TaxID=465721 RepID=A0A127FBN1_STEDE|nr:hypothetical protein ACG33_07850 [Steroidobacter denitrificans]